jgi:hypothetical protein
MDHLGTFLVGLAFGLFYGLWCCMPWIRYLETELTKRGW